MLKNKILFGKKSGSPLKNKRLEILGISEAFFRVFLFKHLFLPIIKKRKKFGHEKNTLLAYRNFAVCLLSP